MPLLGAAQVFTTGMASEMGPELLDYNRENYQFNNELSLKKAYQSFNMRVRQHQLYREDVRDLVDLTIRKMDNYLIVNTLQLGFCVTLFTEGKLEEKEDKTNACPEWLAFLYSLCTAGAFLYFILSMWLAMHASVTAHAFGVRLLTQFVRLPLPSTAQLESVVAPAKSFESLPVKSIFRVPVVKQQFQRLTEAMSNPSAGNTEDVFSDDGPASIADSKSPVANLDHVRLYRKLQVNWQSYDAYSRVCMAIGTNQLLHALSYATLTKLMTNLHVPFAAFAGVIILTMSAWILARLDLHLDQRRVAALALPFIIPPVLTTVSLSLFRHRYVLAIQVIVPIIFLLHAAWIFYTITLAKAEGGETPLPVKFRSILYLDVFSSLSRPPDIDGGGETQESSDGLDGLAAVAEEARPRSADDDLDHRRRYSLQWESCQQKFEELQLDLQRWSSEMASRLLQDNEAARTELAGLRERFEQISAELIPYAAAAAAATGVSPSLGPEGGATVYLKLRYNVSGQGPGLTYYYRCDAEGDDAFIWEPEVPQGREVRILDLRSLAVEVGTLADAVHRLADERRRTEPQLPYPAALQRQTSLVTEAASSAAAAFDPAPSQSFLEEEASASAAPRSTVFQRSRYVPGQLPWHTVLQGTWVLILMWLFGFTWCVANLIFNLRLRFEKRGNGADTIEELAAFAPVLTTSWPHPFFRPVGLACHPRISGRGEHTASLPRLFAAERYAVHEIEVQAEGQALFTQTLHLDCLKGALDFRGRGFADIGLECLEDAAGAREEVRDGDHTRQERGICTAVLLGADGLEALRCPLAFGNTSRVAGLPHRSTLLGGPWRALAAVGRGEIWTLKAEAVARLNQLDETTAASEGAENTCTAAPCSQRGRASTSELSPNLEIARGAAQDLTALHYTTADGGNWLLGLGRPSVPGEPWHLKAWPVSAGGSRRSWSLPTLPGHMEWSGVCTQADSIYFIGMAESESGTKTAALWRAELPSDLRSVVPASA